MKNNRLVFALFAAAVLFSMMREWSAPLACARIVIDQAHLVRRGQ
jgi:hypothetical protein